MIVSASTFFEGKGGERLLKMQDTVNIYPEQYRDTFKAKARENSPMKTGWLKRSIITQVTGQTVKIGWRAKYASAVNEGGHRVPRTVMGTRKDTGEFGIIPAGYYRHKTGSKGFADRTLIETRRAMIEWTERRIQQ